MATALHRIGDLEPLFRHEGGAAIEGGEDRRFVPADSVRDEGVRELVLDGVVGIKRFDLRAIAGFDGGDHSAGD